MSLNAHSLRALNASHASGDMATSESDDFQGESHLSGYLYKQSDHLKQWNLRFFVVGNSDHIKYYKKETDSSPKGFFSVAGCTFTRATKPTVVKGKMLHVFEVSHPLSKNVLRLGSNAEAMTLLWIKTLKQASGEVQDGTEQQETAQRLARAIQEANEAVERSRREAEAAAKAKIKMAAAAEHVKAKAKVSFFFSFFF